MPGTSFSVDARPVTQFVGRVVVPVRVTPRFLSAAVRKESDTPMPVAVAGDVSVSPVGESTLSIVAPSGIPEPYTNMPAASDAVEATVTMSLPDVVLPVICSTGTTALSEISFPNELTVKTVAATAADWVIEPGPVEVSVTLPPVTPARSSPLSESVNAIPPLITPLSFVAWNVPTLLAALVMTISAPLPMIASVVVSTAVNAACEIAPLPVEVRLKRLPATSPSMSPLSESLNRMSPRVPAPSSLFAENVPTIFAFVSSTTALPADDSTVRTSASITSVCVMSALAAAVEVIVTALPMMPPTERPRSISFSWMLPLAPLKLDVAVKLPILLSWVPREMSDALLAVSESEATSRAASWLICPPMVAVSEVAVAPVNDSAASFFSVALVALIVARDAAMYRFTEPLIAVKSTLVAVTSADASLPSSWMEPPVPAFSFAVAFCATMFPTRIAEGVPPCGFDAVSVTSPAVRTFVAVIVPVAETSTFTIAFGSVGNVTDVLPLAVALVDS